jgi:hypothetical protein
MPRGAETAPGASVGPRTPRSDEAGGHALQHAADREPGKRGFYVAPEQGRGGLGIKGAPKDDNPRGAPEAGAGGVVVEPLEGVRHVGDPADGLHALLVVVDPGERRQEAIFAGQDAPSGAGLADLAPGHAEQLAGVGVASKGAAVGDELRGLGAGARDDEHGGGVHVRMRRPFVWCARA